MLRGLRIKDLRFQPRIAGSPQNRQERYPGRLFSIRGSESPEKATSMDGVDLRITPGWYTPDEHTSSRLPVTQAKEGEEAGKRVGEGRNAADFIRNILQNVAPSHDPVGPHQVGEHVQADSSPRSRRSSTSNATPHRHDKVASIAVILRIVSASSAADRRAGAREQASGSGSPEHAAANADPNSSSSVLAALMMAQVASASIPHDSPLHKRDATSKGRLGNFDLGHLLAEADARLEILFISRSLVRRDKSSGQAPSLDARRWSGQVAFPGGRCEREESPLDCAVRECKEEVGLDLSDEDSFALVGELPRGTARKGMPIHSFLFLQVSDSSGMHEIKPCPEEVAAAWWVPISKICGKTTVQTLALPLRAMPWKVAPIVAKVLGVSSITFPCIQLPQPPAPQAAQLAPHQTVLWGLTLGIVSELVKAGGEGDEAPTDRLSQRTWLLGDSHGRPLRGGVASALTAFMRWDADREGYAASLASLSVIVAGGCVIAWAVSRR